jgi:hypothetical protein
METLTGDTPAGDGAVMLGAAAYMSNVKDIVTLAEV